MPVIRLDQLAASTAAAESRRAAARTAMLAICNQARMAGRETLTADEDRRMQALLAERNQATEAMNRYGGPATVSQLRAELAAEQAAWQATRDTGTRAPGQTASLQVGRNERTYRPDTDPKGLGFLRDVGRQLLGDPQATERLARHSREEEIERGALLDPQQRASTTANFSGLVVPQYLTDFFAPAVAAGRPFADAATNHHDLPPEGMTVNFGRLSTPSQVSLQGSEGGAIGNADIDDTLLTENVQTAAGYVQTSRQSVDRGQFTDDNIVEELLRRAATTLDTTLLTQATTGVDALAAGTTTAYTTTGPTAAGLWPKLFAAQNLVETNLLDRGPATHITMHSRRWNWLCSQVSSSWPVIGSASVPPQMQGMILTSEYGSAVRARLSNGVLVVVDGNVGTGFGASTNEDRVYATAQNECHLWEMPGGVTYIRADQPALSSLQVIFCAWLYFAYCFRRYPGACQSVSGTGLITPTFA